MSAGQLKERLTNQLWKVVDEYDHVLSATVTGSFVDAPSLEGLSDIDFVVVVDRLTQARFTELVQRFDESLRGPLAEAGYDLLVNPTLGPLKFNDHRLAVLHLMLYSHEAHVEHVLQSPFTCFDWQRSPAFRKRSLADVYPVFGLQPRHFIDARRSISDYLRDYHARVVSYRELDCHDSGYEEVKRCKPMTDRDRHEFAYHVLRFLMRNLLKLVSRSGEVPTKADDLVAAYFAVFPDGQAEASELFFELARKKRQLDFATALPDLDEKLQAFVACFERQFRRAFIDDATRHVVFRHAATPANIGERRFVGRTDHAICDAPADVSLLEKAWESVRPQRCLVSPLTRCRQSLELLRSRHGEMPVQVVEDLVEIHYGDCEGLTVSEGRTRYPELFAAWSQSGDPRFPGGGENTEDVTQRALRFVEQHLAQGGNSAVCTHNVVIRSLLGTALGVPRNQWHRIQVPHLAPLTFIYTPRFGLFVELNPTVERELFRDFATLQN